MTTIKGLETEVTQPEKQKIELARGVEYSVELYPQKEKVSAVYLGKVRDDIGCNHVFASETDYIIVNNSRMIEEDGVITYHPYSSFTINRISKEKLRASLRLIKTLEELGEKI